ncbi:MAG: 30S ribosomal protein S9 [Candidatus Sumerlaeota bacterium]|nr:30S ribosomal protein S9 [Candidatus Sumerlaeota bacterium]
MAEALEQYLGTGRRKSATARVYLRPGKGKITINKKPSNKYFFDQVTLEHVIRQPLLETHTATKYDLLINVAGGGVVGQAEAIRHGIARALCAASIEYRPVLKKAGFLTRDAREKERKKYGQPGARKHFQFSKR